ncbi:MAG: hypothetical protein WAM71_10510 [Candidatus Korobacteraceae bacterium]
MANAAAKACRTLSESAEELAFGLLLLPALLSPSGPEPRFSENRTFWLTSAPGKSCDALANKD